MADESKISRSDLIMSVFVDLTSAEASVGFAKQTLVPSLDSSISLGSIDTFHGTLNPLSGRSIYKACIIPTLLYRCETWFLDISTLEMLERFQCEIGRRILRLPKHHSSKVVRLGLLWPSVSTRIFICKLTFLGSYYPAQMTSSAVESLPLWRLWMSTA